MKCSSHILQKLKLITFKTFFSEYSSQKRVSQQATTSIGYSLDKFTRFDHNVTFLGMISSTAETTNKIQIPIKKNF